MNPRSLVVEADHKARQIGKFSKAGKTRRYVHGRLTMHGAHACSGIFSISRYPLTLGDSRVDRLLWQSFATAELRDECCYKIS